ncbi:MAG: ion transporter, partial [Pseudomonadales bacterium]
EGGFEGRFGSRLTSTIIVTLIVLNTLAIVFESMAAIHETYQDAFALFEAVSIAIFTLEYLGRVWVAPEAPTYQGPLAGSARRRYVTTLPALIDLAAILPAYFAMFFAVDLRLLRLFRLLRLLKLTHHFPGLALFFSVINQELRTLLSALFTILILMLLAASLMYVAEHQVQPEVFGSIPSAFWWAVVTMTTVGYGDVLPITSIGKLLATFIMLLGIGVVALPAGILAARFGEELRIRRETLSIEVAKAMKDGLINTPDMRNLIQSRHQLGLSQKQLEQLIHNHQVRTEQTHCPHCGEPIT